jgi:competence protein ComFA
LSVTEKDKKTQQTGFQFSSTLTPHQQQASDVISTAINKQERHLVIHAVCGAGKTEMLFHGVNEALKNGKRVALATPRQDVIKELLPRFQAVFTELSIICQYGGSEDNHQQAWLTLCTTHQLIRYKAAFDVLMIDEVDAFPYHNDTSLMKLSERALKDQGTFIYLSATPRPSLVKKRYPTCFVPVRYHGHPLPVPVPYFISFKHTPLPKKLIQAINLERHNHRQLLLFVATVKQAEALLPKLQATHPNIKIEAVHAASDDRKSHIDQFRYKSIDILITTTILERGVTFPSVDVFVLQADHDVFDEAALVQIAGRAGRSKDDPDGWVHFYFETYTKAIRGAIKAIKKMNALGEQL